MRVMNQPAQTRQHTLNIAVFCADAGTEPSCLQTAETIGRGLAERGIHLVYGGGSLGLMGAVASAALDAGGQVTGVISRTLHARGLAHTGLSELRVVADPERRTRRIRALADAFLILPGNVATLDELATAWAATTLDSRRRTLGVLAIAGRFRSLLHVLHTAAEAGLLGLPADASPHDLVLIDDDPDRLLTAVIDRARRATRSRPEALNAGKVP